MKNLFLFLVIYFFVVGSQAQTIPPFFTHFDIDSHADTGGALLAVGDSAFWVLGQGSKRNIEGWYSTHLSLHKVNLKGEVLVEKYYGGPYETWGLAGAESSVVTYDGNFMASGIWKTYDSISQIQSYCVRLLKFDPNGDSIWTKSYNWGKQNFVSSLIQAPDSGFLITGYNYVPGDTKPDMFVLKTDVQGKEEWIYTAGYMNQSDRAVSVIPSPHGYLIGAGGFNRINASNDGMIILLNHKGKKITEWFYSEVQEGSECGIFLFPIYNSTDFYMIHCHPDTSINGSRKFIVNYLARVDISGQIKWKRWLAGPGFRNLWRAKELPNGDIMVAGQWTPENPEEPFNKYGWLGRYSPEGEPLWESFILPEDTSQIRIEDFILAEDGGFYCTGMFLSLSLSASDIAFFKTDSFGCIQPGCQIYAGVEEEIAEKNLRIYPNPASERLYIEAENPQRNMQLQVVDVHGRSMHLEEEAVFSGKKEIDVSTWKSGMYWVLWTVDGQLKRSQSIVITN
jgi:hypothetical protein